MGDFAVIKGDRSSVTLIIFFLPTRWPSPSAMTTSFLLYDAISCILLILTVPFSGVKDHAHLPDTARFLETLASIAVSGQGNLSLEHQSVRDMFRCGIKFPDLIVSPSPK